MNSDHTFYLATLLGLKDEVGNLGVDKWDCRSSTCQFAKEKKDQRTFGGCRCIDLHSQDPALVRIIKTLVSL